MALESKKLADVRFGLLECLQQEFKYFKEFLDVGMDFLGFDCTEIQYDIAEFMQFGPNKCMIQAQRSQAKTTIAALYAIWMLIHFPKFRVLIVSASGKNSSDISTMIIKIIMGLDILECMRPDTSAGDRTSVQGFDIHHSLRRNDNGDSGSDKSCSISCVGVTGTMTSKRADLIIPDDIEAPGNSGSDTERMKLIERSKEFADLCTDGKIMYLGTPQHIDSVYNTLPSRGYTIRIWPGRYPTPQQMENYGEYLAPFISNRIRANPSLQTGGGILGDQGMAVDTRMNESILQEKEAEHGAERFQLQYMLDTTLSDKMRYPLKSENLIYAKDPGDLFPLTVSKDVRPSALREFSVLSHNFKIPNAGHVSNDSSKLMGKVMYIDPAAGGQTTQDETAYAVIGFLNGNIWLLDIGGVPGGYGVDRMEELAKVAKTNNVERVIIEKNLGFGAFREIFTPILMREHSCDISDDMVSTQKEKRIEGILGPILGRGSLIVTDKAVENDLNTLTRHPANKRQLYSLFFQMNKMTMMKGSLAHDDRLDALAGACNYFIKAMAIDQTKKIQAIRLKEEMDFLNDPFGRKKWQKAQTVRTGSSFFKNYRK